MMWLDVPFETPVHSMKRPVKTMDEPERIRQMKKWRRREKFLPSEYLIGYGVPAFLVTAVLSVNSGGLWPVYALLGIVVLPECAILFLLWKIHLYRRDMWTKLFRIKPELVVSSLNSCLYNGKVSRKRLSQYAGLPGFPLSYCEIFELEHGKVFIRVRGSMGRGSGVERGPVTDDARSFVEEMKGLVDECLHEFAG